MIVFNWEVYEQPNVKDATSGQLVAYQNMGAWGSIVRKKTKSLSTSGKVWLSQAQWVTVSKR
jgi:hypothetical protein